MSTPRIPAPHPIAAFSLLAVAALYATAPLLAQSHSRRPSRPQNGAPYRSISRTCRTRIR